MPETHQLKSWSMDGDTVVAEVGRCGVVYPAEGESHMTMFTSRVTCGNCKRINAARLRRTLDRMRAEREGGEA